MDKPSSSLREIGNEASTITAILPPRTDQERLWGKGSWVILVSIYERCFLRVAWNGICGFGQEWRPVTDGR